MQSFSYLLIYFFKLSLPWSNIKSKDYESKIQKMIDIHKKINDSILCNNLPYQISYIVSEINKLNYAQMPNYDNYIKALTYLMELDDNKDKEFFVGKKVFQYLIILRIKII